MLDDKFKTERKQTIKAWNMLKILDVESKPTPPPLVRYHPRAFNKSMSCQLGQHSWVTKQWRWSPWYYGTIPVLWCKKCGAFRFKDSHEGTETQRELRTRHVPHKLNKSGLLDILTSIQEDVPRAKK